MSIIVPQTLDSSDGLTKAITADGGRTMSKKVPARIADPRNGLALSEEERDEIEFDTPDEEGEGGPEALEMEPWQDRTRVLQIIRADEENATTYAEQNTRTRWARTIKAFHNQHFDGSKYTSEMWKGRSKLFRPKTRAAVRKNMAAAARALFGPGNVVVIDAQDAGDQMQRASAALKQEIVNYRLSRTSRRNGVRWKQIALGARQDSLLCGVCGSKQTWRYKEREIINEFGEPDVEIIEDRPDIILYAPENMLFSSTCDWTNPAQSSEFLILRNPLSVSEAMDMIKSNEAGKVIQFDDLTEEDLLNTSSDTLGGPSDTNSTRLARHDGNDPNQQTKKTSPVVWLNECFRRIDGEDVVFWMLGRNRIISDPIPVHEAYPAVEGERPVVIGYGELESHRAYPMAPAESWQQLQQEINDGANMRADHMKQVVGPLAMIKRGAQVDLKAVQTRGAHNGVVMVNNPTEDIVYAQIPDVPQSAYVEGNYLAAEFDDLAGSFNASSVQTNRAMNETVGGMKMLSADAGTMVEYDLDVWIETYVEPVMWQFLKNVEYYESDETVLMFAGDKAQLVMRYGVSEITDELLRSESQLTVKVGIGVANLPMERLQKFGMAAKMTGEILTPFVQAGVAKMPQPKMKEIFETIFGEAGFHDAADRFFIGLTDEPAPPEPQGPPPEMQAKLEEMKAKIEADRASMEQKMAFEREKAQLEMQIDREKLAMEQARFQAEMARDQQKFDQEQMWREREFQQKANLAQMQAELARKNQQQDQELKAEAARASAASSHEVAMTKAKSAPAPAQKPKGK